MIFYVYIIQSLKDGSFYIGSSKDPGARLVKHNSPHSGYTARKQPWIIVYTQPFPSKAEAIKRERFIKKQKSRTFIQKLILEQNND